MLTVGTCLDHNRLNDLDNGTDLLHRGVNSLFRFLRREETGAERYIRKDRGYDDEGKTIAASRPVNALSSGANGFIPSSVRRKISTDPPISRIYRIAGRLFERMALDANDKHNYISAP
jgi:hypothetical protein